MKEGSRIYDLGCSTGNITAGLVNLKLSHQYQYMQLIEKSPCWILQKKNQKVKNK